MAKGSLAVLKAKHYVQVTPKYIYFVKYENQAYHK